MASANLLVPCLVSASLVSMMCAASIAGESNPTQQAPGASNACGTAEHQQFDFWLGRWEVTDPKGKRLGTNVITRSETGCWIVEQWRSAGGFSGTSVNAWDAPYQRWRQFWVGSDGIVLRLEGGLRAGTMVMEGTLPTPGGGSQRQRIRWTPNADGTVSQHWETSDDDGNTWATAFLGIYRRKADDKP
jgi:hypothetical protein